MPIRHTVKEGDCLASIAAEYGFFPDTIWNDPANKELRERRASPYILSPGDTVVIPEKRVKQIEKPASQKHRFRRKGVPAILRICVLSDLIEAVSPPPPPDSDALHVRTEDPDPPLPEAKPLKNAPYSLEIDGVVRQGKSDGEGYVQLSIPPHAKGGTLIIHPGTEQERRYPLKFGALGPYDTVRGIKQRLANLGYETGPIDDKPGPELAGALRAFQYRFSLPTTGEADATTREKLREAHGS
jgi:N-acetylmuramoyl-L-alanine amidase